ncbi:TPA: hypothetical protein ACNUVO_002820 [Aeromonas salmonicida subsp. pectinolytica]
MSSRKMIVIEYKNWKPLKSITLSEKEVIEMLGNPPTGVWEASEIKLLDDNGNGIKYIPVK